MPISDAAVELLLTRWRDDVLIYLLTITHPQLETVRWARNNLSITSRGDTFSPAPFDLKLPPDNEQLPDMVITIPNVQRKIGRRILLINHGMTANLEAVFASAPDDVWKSILSMELHNVSFDTHMLTGTLSHRRVTHEPFPNRRVIPNKFFAYYR